MYTLPKLQTGELGYLLMNLDGAIIASRGDLENDEQRAQSLSNFIQSCRQVELWPQSEDGEAEEEIEVHRMSLTYPNYCYMMCLTNKKMHIIKKQVNLLSSAKT